MLQYLWVKVSIQRRGRSRMQMLLSERMIGKMYVLYSNRPSDVRSVRILTLALSFR